MTMDARFCIGSITKTYVAVVVLQLVEEGLIGLGASMEIYLPEETAAGSSTQTLTTPSSA